MSRIQNIVHSGTYNRIRREQQVQTMRTRKPKQRNSFSVVVEETDMQAIEEHIAENVRVKVLQKAIENACSVVEAQYRNNLAPHRSINTGTREGWSKKIREKRANRPHDLFDSVGRKVKHYRRPKGLILGMIGAKRPDAAHASLLEFGAAVVLWGTDITFPMKARFPLRRAGEETKALQRMAMESTAKGLGEKF